MKQTAKFGCRVLIALLCLSMLISVITIPAFAADNSALANLTGKDMGAFIDLINKYNSVKDDPDAAEQLKEYVRDQYESDASFKESADEILGGQDQDDTMGKLDTVIDDVLVNDEYVGDIDDVVDAVQNGASFDEIKESIEYQKEEKEKQENDPDYVPPTCEVSWVVDGVVVHTESLGYKKMIKPVTGTTSAGKYVKWDNEIMFVPVGAETLTIKGHTVDIVEKVISDVNSLPVNYNEYRIDYEDGVATLVINVDASDYKQIILDILGDVRSGDTASVYREAITAFLQSSATELYNGKVTDVTVNGNKVVEIEGYGITELVDLLETVENGNYGQIISAEGLKNALLKNPITPNDLAEMGDDGLLATYDIVLSAEDKADSEITLNVALEGDLDLVRKGAKAIAKAADMAYDFAKDANGDITVNIVIPGAFTMMMTKALNHADVSDETKKTIVSGMNQCATVGELLDLFDLLEYDQFIAVVEYMFDNVEATDDKEAAMLEKIEAARPAFDLFKKYGEILIEKAPESIEGKEASLTVKSIYNLTQMVSYSDLANLTQIKDADALVQNRVYADAVARVANKLQISEARAQEIVNRMVDAVADFQNRIPDSEKAQAAFDRADALIDLLYNKIPEKLQNAQLPDDAYKGNSVFSFEFSKTYNPGAWLKKVLDKVTINVHGRSITLGDHVPVRDITSDVFVSVTVTDLYSVTFVDENGVELFKGFLPYDAELAPYCAEQEKFGYEKVLYDQDGMVVTHMPAADSIITVAFEANEYTITFVDENGNVLFSDLFAYGTHPVYGGATPTKDSDNYNNYTFAGWTADGVVYAGQLPVVTGDATYTTVFEATDRYFTITFDILGNKYAQAYKYGETPAFDAELDYLNFEGWEGFGLVLPAVTGDATYVANYTATIIFNVAGEEYYKVTVPYGTPAASFLPVDPEKTDLIFGQSNLTSYEFDAWVNETTGRGVTAAVANTSYGATFADVQTGYGSGVWFDSDNNRFTIDAGDMVVIDRRLTATVQIPELILNLAGNGYGLQIGAYENGKLIYVTFGNEALLDLAANATGDVSFVFSKLVGAEDAWTSTGLDFDSYAGVYVFDLYGSGLLGDLTFDVQVPFASNAAKYNTYLWHVVGGGYSKVEDATVDSDYIGFKSNGNGYYAISYEQYLFTVKFYNWNGGNTELLNTVIVNKNLGETLTGIPTFQPGSEDVCYVSVKWGRLVGGSFRALADKYGNDVVAYFEENLGDMSFYAQLRDVGHSYDYTELEPATCTDPGLEEGVCRVCGHTAQFEIEPLGHDWKWIPYDEHQHVQVCSRCDLVGEYGDHIFGENDVCILCGYYRGAAIEYVPITFVVLDKQYIVSVEKGTVPSLDEDNYIFDILNFKGWMNEEGQALGSLPVATEPATYTAFYTATITFIVDGEIRDECEVGYGEMPTAPNAEKAPEWVDNEYYIYTLKWMAEDATEGIKIATQHAIYEAAYDETVYSFGDDITIERIVNDDGSITYKVTISKYNVAVGYVYVQLNIAPIVKFADVENSNLLIVIVGDNDIVGAHDMKVDFDNAALDSIHAHYTTAYNSEDMMLTIMSRNKSGWPNADTDKYAAVYGFEIDAYTFSSVDGKVSITVPFEKDMGTYDAKIYYLGDAAEDMNATIVDRALNFVTNHFSFYGVEYTEKSVETESSSEEVTTEPGEVTTVPGDGTTEPGDGTTEPGDGTTQPGDGTTEPGDGTTEPGGDTSEPESESDTTSVDDPGKKNGWWIFLIVLLVIIAILIVAYILYGHNLFPKGPATEEPAAEAEEEELTDAQKGAATVVEPVVEEEIVHVDHVSAEEADTLMTDAQAVNSVVLIACTATGKMGAVNVGTLNEHYENGDKVDIDNLKEKKLIAADCKRVKILADGDLDKELIVEANSFSLQAIKMITLTGGHAIKLQPEVPETPAQEAADDAIAEETGVEETPVEETPVEETPVEEAPAEEATEETAEVTEEAPVEEAPAEEAPAEESDAE